MKVPQDMALGLYANLFIYGLLNYGTLKMEALCFTKLEHSSTRPQVVMFQKDDTTVATSNVT
jgi:hypothetical protein